MATLPTTKSPIQGEIWKFVPIGAGVNPFAKSSHEVEVLEVLNKWVRYRFVGTTMWQNESMRIDSFRKCYQFKDTILSKSNESECGRSG